MFPFQVLVAVQAARLVDDVAPWPVVLTVAILSTPWIVTAIAVWRLLRSKGSGDDDSGPPGGGPGPRPDGTLQPGPGGISICWPEFERQLAEYIAENAGRRRVAVGRPADRTRGVDMEERRDIPEGGDFAEGEETLPRNTHKGSFAEGEETLPRDEHVGSFAEGEETQPRTTRKGSFADSTEEED